MQVAFNGVRLCLVTQASTRQIHVHSHPVWVAKTHQQESQKVLNHRIGANQQFFHMTAVDPDQACGRQGTNRGCARLAVEQCNLAKHGALRQDSHASLMVALALEHLDTSLLNDIGGITRITRLKDDLQPLKMISDEGVHCFKMLQADGAAGPGECQSAKKNPAGFKMKTAGFVSLAEKAGHSIYWSYFAVSHWCINNLRA